LPGADIGAASHPVVSHKRQKVAGIPFRSM
jgi:hypothetical protein